MSGQWCKAAAGYYEAECHTCGTLSGVYKAALKVIGHMTIQEACQRLGKSESTVRRWLRQKKLEAIKVDGLWDIPEAAVNDYLNDQSPADSDQSNDQADDQVVDRLKEENAYLKERIQEFETARERQDTIILQLTRQTEQSQRLLEYQQEPWYRRVFGKKGKREDA